ncbi:hypothetical protein CFY87_02570 [Actinobacillus seminis]|nr:hypothetical protein CFY87_02570 [Actinobacillus seminis]
MDYNTTSWLAKLGYRFNSTHFISSFYEDLHQDRNIEEKSFYLANRQKVSDTTPYRRYGLIYEYTPENTWLHRLGLQFTHQEVYQKSNSFQYGTGIKITYNPTPDWNLITDTRVYEFQQNRYQFDTELKTTDFQVLSTTHSLTFGSGFHIGKLTNRNVEHKYNAYSKQTTTKKFTIQQPVKTQLIYGYIKDNIMINDNYD